MGFGGGSVRDGPRGGPNLTLDHTHSADKINDGGGEFEVSGVKIPVGALL